MSVEVILSLIGASVAIGGFAITIYRLLREHATERAKLTEALDHVGKSLTKLDITMGKVLERVGSLEVRVAVLEERVD